MNKKITVVVLLIVALCAVLTPVLAQEPITLESLQAQIDTLIAEIETLKAQIAALTPNAAADALPPAAAQNVITLEGLYRVPDEMPYGTWEFRSSDPTKNCPVTTYSSLSSDWDNMIDFISTNNKGYFIIDQTVKMVELETSYGATCTWSRIGD